MEIIIKNDVQGVQGVQGACAGLNPATALPVQTCSVFYTFPCVHARRVFFNFKNKLPPLHVLHVCTHRIVSTFV
jgi:hypothetical protein